MPSAKLSDDMVDEAIPGNIRKAEHFVAFLKRFIEYLKVSWQMPRSQWKLTGCADANEGAPCRRGDATIVSSASEGDHLHREAAVEVSASPS